MLRRNYPVSALLRASPPPTRPGLALAGCPLRLPPPSLSVSRASCAFLRYVPSLSTPVEPQRASVASLPLQCCLPRVSVRSASTTSVSRPHRAFTFVTARIFAGPLLVLSIEGSDGFVASSAASIATGQATLPRRDSHPLKHTRIHGARAHNIISDVEVIPIQKVNEAYERLLKSDVKYRFSIDMASLKSS